MTKNWLLTVTFAIAMATGCSRSASTSTAAAARVGSTAVAAVLPTFAGALAGSSALPAEPPPPRGMPNGANVALSTAAPAPASPFPETGNLFAPPRVVIPVVTKEPEPELQPEPAGEEPKKEKPLPQLRLVGFVEVEGLKALLSVAGKLNVMTIGESAEGLQIIAIEPPAVTLKFGADGEEFQMNLYDQPWFHQPGAFSAERKSFGGKPVMPRGSAVPSMPGIGGANGPPGIPGFVGAPGAPALQGTGMPNILGFPGENTSANTKNSKKSSKHSPAQENMNRGMPGMPSLPGVSGMPGERLSGAAPIK